MTIEFQDYYSTLGVSKTASPKEIQKAYRTLAQKYHPDVSKEPGAAEKFVKINEAYEVLNNPENRKKYDLLGKDWKHGQNFEGAPGWDYQRGPSGQPGSHDAGQGYDFHFEEGAGFSDFFEQIFGQQRAHREQARNQPHPGLTKEATIELTVADLYSEAKKQISLETTAYDASGNPQRTIKSYQVSIPAGTKMALILD